ncbi:hypothetical protein ACFSMW_05305 [Virgibacillus halophilus]|uniref:Uncharacterized protein n=1 Tax=Tigheibacillus halophilus TaxID=361280 RepID=A0ABU5CBC1_9BACI|nr:hypothetical protein [Virgibacillus halophilus]
MNVKCIEAEVSSTVANMFLIDSIIDVDFGSNSSNLTIRYVLQLEEANRICSFGEIQSDKNLVVLNGKLVSMDKVLELLDHEIILDCVKGKLITDNPLNSFFFGI